MRFSRCLVRGEVSGVRFERFCKLEEKFFCAKRSVELTLCEINQTDWICLDTSTILSPKFVYAGGLSQCPCRFLVCVATAPQRCLSPQGAIRGQFVEHKRLEKSMAKLASNIQALEVSYSNSLVDYLNYLQTSNLRLRLVRQVLGCYVLQILGSSNAAWAASEEESET